VSAAPRLGLARDPAFEPVGSTVRDVSDRAVLQVNVGPLIGHEALGGGDGFALDSVGDGPDGVRLVAADPVQDRAGRVRDADGLVLVAVDRVPHVGIAPLRCCEDALVVDLARRPPALGFAVGDVLVGPLTQCRPRADRGQRADPPAAVTGVPRLIAVSVDQGRGVGNLEVVPDRRVRESTHVVYGNGFVRIVSRHDQSGIRPLVVGFGTRLESLASDLEGAVGVAFGVNRERGVPPRFVLDGGIEPDEEQPRDARQVSFLEPVCDLPGDVRRTHASLARVGIVDPDDGHRPCLHASRVTPFGIPVTAVAQSPI
jgi:hypothetical protein